MAASEGTLTMALLLAYLGLEAGSQSQSQAEKNRESNAAAAKRIVAEMRGFSMQHHPGGEFRSDGTPNREEQRRLNIERRLHALGQDCLPALTKALSDPDVQMRRNSELVMIMLAGGYAGLRPKLDIRPAIPELMKAMQDQDKDVRAWAAHALAEIGPDAKDTVPLLIKQLADPEEGPRNTSCMALGRIGPAAKDALPALRAALNDPKKDVRQFARGAIRHIEVKAEKDR